MKRLAILCALLFAASCDKPTPEDCEKALRNMQTLMGTENLNETPASLQGEIRRCRGGSTKKSVECAVKATTLAELETCDFEKTSPYRSPGSAGSAAGSAGSAK
jgi:hypothetical protein